MIKKGDIVRAVGIYVGKNGKAKRGAPGIVIDVDRDWETRKQKAPSMRTPNYIYNLAYAIRLVNR